MNSSLAIRLSFFLLCWCCVSAFCPSGFAKESSGKRDWTDWRTLPVYDEGRVMPLNTFSRLIVARICGTNRPHIVLEPSLLESLRHETSGRFEHDHDFALKESRRIRERIETLFPEKERTFESHELLFSWIVEPEIWEFIPFLPCEHVAFRKEILLLADRDENGRSLNALAPIQLDRSERYGNYLETLQEKEYARTHAGETGETSPEEFRGSPSRQERLNEETAKELYQALTHYRHLIYRTQPFFDAPPTAVVEHLWNAGRSFSAAARSFDRVAYQGMERATAQGTISPQENMAAVAVLFSELVRLSDPREHADTSPGKISRNTSRENIELHMELLLDTVEATIENSESFLRELYPEMTGGDRSARRTLADSGMSGTRYASRRTDAIVFNSSMISMRRSVQAAYLSLYKTGRTIHVLPALYEDAIRTDVARNADAMSGSEFGPWVPLNLVLNAGSRTIRRFVDRDFPLKSAESPPAEQLVFLETEAGRSLSPAVKSRMLAFLRTGFDEERQKRESESVNSTQRFRTALGNLIAIYTGNEGAAEKRESGENGKTPSTESTVTPPHPPWSDTIRLVSESLRATAERMRETRGNLFPETQRNDATLRKTAYPAPDALEAEYWYYRLDPFFWMGIASAISVGAFVMSFLPEVPRKVRRRPKRMRVLGRVADILEESLFCAGFAALAVSVAAIVLGGAMRAWISGWAPVTNMYETIVMMCLCAALLSLWFSFQSFLTPPLSRAWNAAAFFRQDCDNENKTENRISNAAPLRVFAILLRLGLIVTVFRGGLYLAYREYAGDHGLLGAVHDSFLMNDRIDGAVVAVCMIALLWFVPRILAAFLLFPVFCLTGEGNSVRFRNFRSAFSGRGFVRAKKQVLSRKIFPLIGASIVLLGAAATHWNTADFNPNIRPLQAVLRSNFWLAVHVSAIVVGYASGLIAWLLALTVLGTHIFGRRGAAEYCDMLAPYVRNMIRFSLWMLMIGTILGGRWADYSWGRFWSWDPKEVWALITIILYLLVLHGHIGRFYGKFGLAVGAVLGAIAIVMTWYGFNFVFNVGRHAYGHGNSDWAKFFLLGFAFVNLLWIAAAAFRYAAAKSFPDPSRGGTPDASR